MSKKKGPGRCTGHCCRSFQLRYAPDDLQRRAAESRSGRSSEPEIEKIASMVIYLGQFHTNPIQKTHYEGWTDKALRIAMRAEMRPVEDGELYNEQNGGHWYACKHLQLNGDCGVFGDDKKRPKLCSTYPDGELCKFDACTMPIDTQVAQLSERGELAAVHYYERNKLIPPKSLLKKKAKNMRLWRHENVKKLDVSQPIELKGEKVLSVKVKR